MEKSKLNAFIKRVLSTIVLVPVVVGCIYNGYPTVELLVMLAAALLSWEWAVMVPNKRPAVYAVTYLFVTISGTLLASFWGYVFALLSALALLYYKTRDEKHRRLLLLGVPYISIGIGAIYQIYGLYSAQLVLWYLFVIWGVDIGGYLFGCTIKGPKLAPKISPNKTWAGLFGGMLLAAVFGSIVCWAFAVTDAGVLKVYAVIAAILAVIAQIGDLIESAVKRYLGIKDSSDLIPGHGGIFDRIDGLIFAAPFAVLILRNLLLFY